MKVVGIIQARTGSTRFPNKVLEKINNKTLLEYYIERVKFSTSLDQIVLATTVNPADNIIEEIAQKEGISYLRGSENDLLDRYYEAAKRNNANIVVRLTSDDAFVDPDVIDRAVKIFQDNYLQLDFVNNHLEPSYPEGLDVEVYAFDALAFAWRHSKLKSEREHVFLSITNYPEKYSIYTFKNNEDYSFLRWTVDYECDFEMVKKVYKKLYQPNRIFKYDDLIALYKTNPEIFEINSHIKRKEGVNKTIAEDKNEKSV
jgi:spore coat polysaccharide biosynthesis protein SpsF